MLNEDRTQLKNGGIETTTGDERCMLFGQAARVAIRHLGPTWKLDMPTSEKLAIVQGVLEELIRLGEPTNWDRDAGESVAEIPGAPLPL